MFERNKPSIMTVRPRVLCDVCNTRCDRGIKGNNPNICMPKVSKKIVRKNASLVTQEDM
jgi:hypothetical protein